MWSECVNGSVFSNSSITTIPNLFISGVSQRSCLHEFIHAKFWDCHADPTDIGIKCTQNLLTYRYLVICLNILLFQYYNLFKTNVSNIFLIKPICQIWVPHRLTYVVNKHKYKIYCYVTVHLCRSVIMLYFMA